MDNDNTHDAAEPSPASAGSVANDLYGGGFNRWLESIGKSRETATNADELQWLKLERQRLRAERSLGPGPLGMPRVVRRMMRARVHTISGLAESVTIECSSCEEAMELIGWLESLPHQLDEWKASK
jgi:hypothetical protein